MEASCCFCGSATVTSQISKILERSLASAAASQIMGMVGCGLVESGRLWDSWWVGSREEGRGGRGRGRNMPATGGRITREECSHRQLRLVRFT